MDEGEFALDRMNLCLMGRLGAAAPSWAAERTMIMIIGMQPSGCGIFAWQFMLRRPRAFGPCIGSGSDANSNRAHEVSGAGIISITGTG
jgi:hypothetical protein